MEKSLDLAIIPAGSLFSTLSTFMLFYSHKNGATKIKKRYFRPFRKSPIVVDAWSYLYLGPFYNLVLVTIGFRLVLMLTYGSLRMRLFYK